MNHIVTIDEVSAEIQRHHQSELLSALLTDLRSKKLALRDFCKRVRLLIGGDLLVRTVHGLHQSECRRELARAVSAALEGDYAVTENHSGLCLLAACAMHGMVDEGRRLIEGGVAPDQDGGAALREAVAHGHLEFTELLLGAGASVHLGSWSGGLKKAEEMERKGQVAPESAAALVLHRARGWCPATHRRMPAPARARAVELLKLGYLLSYQPFFSTEAHAIVDLWRSCVLPHAVFW